MQTRKVRTGVTLMSLAGIAGTIALCPEVTLAQIVPDETLGEERSTVTRETIRGINSDRIDGGARRGQNLFHSFQQFDVLQGEGAYFSNPDGVANIFSRVTGADRSEIMGRLGVLGNANLFFMNPNGILFGVNSSLDVTGSFVGTTANGIQFGEQGFFSATNPELPSPLLTIDPSVFLFNQIPTGGSVSITNLSRSNGAGLRVGSRENLLLLGGAIVNNGGLISSFGGRIEIGSISGIGSVGFNSDGSLDLPQNLERGDISFTNRSFVGNYTLDSGRNTVVTGRNIDLSGQSEIGTGSLSISPPESQAGDILLNATGMIYIREGSRVSNLVLGGTSSHAGAIRIRAESLLLSENARLNTTIFGQGNAGDIVIDAQNLVSLDGGSTIFGGPIAATGSGDGGNVQITTDSFSMTNGSRLVTYVDGSGNAGNISIDAQNQLLLSGNAAIRNNAQRGSGNGGNIRISSQSVVLSDEASISSATLTQGNAGNVVITASDHVSVSGGASIDSFNFTDSGVGGNILIQSRSASLTGGGLLITQSFGQGNAGAITIATEDKLAINTGATINSRTEGAGTGGDIQIQAGSLEIIGDGARQVGESEVGFSTGLLTSTAGSGNSGSIVIDASNQIALDNGGVITTRVDEGYSGNSGEIRVNTGSLTVRGLSSLITNSSGSGDAGNIIINARDNILFSGGILDSPVRSSVRSNVTTLEATGNSGNIEITTGSLRVEDLAALSTATSGTGDTGDVIINARDTVVFDNGIILTRIEPTATGNGGDIRVTANSLSLINGGQLDASTFGRGDSGDVIVTARDRVILDGISPFRGEDGNPRASTLFTEVVPGAEGNGGDVIVTTGSLLASNGGRLEASTEGKGNAGSVIINARDLVSFDGTSPNGEISSGALSNVVTGAEGNGGNLEINAANLRVTNGAQLDASTEGRGSAGNITIRVEDTVAFDGGSRDGRLSSAAFTRVDREAVGNGGNLEITADIVSLTNGASLQAETLEQGNAGNVTVNARDRVLIDGFRDRELGVSETGARSFRRFLSGISSDVGREAVGEGGYIHINTPLLSITNQASINASTSGTGNAGSIRIPEAQTITLDHSTISTAVNSNATGIGGQIILNTDSLTLNNQSTISSSTSGIGDTGAITITANEINLNDRSSITNAVNLGAIGNARQITLNVSDLSLQDSRISAETSGQGDAGNIRIRNTDRISLNNSTIATDVSPTGIGTGGRIAINTERLNLNNRSRISARTQGQGRAGDIDVFAVIVSLSNGSRLQTNTSSNQNAGNITLRVNDRIAIEGRRSGIFASTTGNARGDGGFIQLNSHDIHLNQRGQISAQSRGRGQAGRIQIQATGDLELEERSAISTQSQRNQAGDIAIQADRIEATHSDITTSAVRSSGGNIRLVASQIRLNGDSDLRTNSRTEGGNITLSADSILAFEDSDIFAFAGVRGGDIQLDTPAFFGNQYQSSSTSNSPEDLDGNDRTDINASGQVSSGEIATPDTSLIQNSLSDLPESAIDTQALISSSCVVRREEQSGSFTVTGTEGLPERPGELPRPRFPTGEVRSVPDAASDSGAGWQVGDPIVEPQGVYQLPDGQLVLSRECN
ncbi:MAG TPA: filamentous hemagglutinin N-terminal domain-containing protein [Allocoleopsis sp.]